MIEIFPEVASSNGKAVVLEAIHAVWVNGEFGRSAKDEKPPDTAVMQKPIANDTIAIATNHRITRFGVVPEPVGKHLMPHFFSSLGRSELIQHPPSR